MDVSPYHYEPVSCTIKLHGRELCKNSKEHFANVIGRKRGSLVGNFILQKNSNNRDVNQSSTATHVTKDKDSSITCERSSASWSWRDTHKHQRKRTKAKQTRRMVQQRAKDLPALKEGDDIWIKPQHLGLSRWLRGTVVAERSEPRSYDVKASTREVIRRNRKHLKERIGAEQDYSMSTNTSCEEVCEEDEQPEQENNAAVDDPYYRTRSGRISKPPDRFSYYSFLS